MAIFWIIPLILLAASLGVIVFVLAKKIPQLRVIDVEAIPTERVKKIKENLILQRFERMSSEKLGGVARASSSAMKTASKFGRRAVQKLYKLEQYYQKLKQAPSAAEGNGNSEAVQKLLHKAEELIREEEFIPAEKIYIEVISHHPKMVDAYEGLGNLYLKAKQYGQARETLNFTLRLSPGDASVHMSLADLEIKEGNLKAAVEHLRQSTTKRPNNPKYLDAYIETSLEAGLAEDAKKGIDQMKEANPENQAIPEWEERLAALEKNKNPAE